MDFKGTIKQYIVEQFLKGDDISLLKDDALLFKDGIIDSVQLLDLLMYIESIYQITVADDELIPENFESIQSIEQFLKKKLRILDKERQNGSSPHWLNHTRSTINQNI